MSDFGVWESIETSDSEIRVASKKSQDKLAAAIYDVQDKYGEFLYAATALDEFHDRVALVKSDMMKTIDQSLPPVTGVVRRVVKACKDEWRQRIATEADGGFGSHSDPSVPYSTMGEQGVTDSGAGGTNDVPANLPYSSGNFGGDGISGGGGFNQADGSARVAPGGAVTAFPQGSPNSASMSNFDPAGTLNGVGGAGAGGVTDPTGGVMSGPYGGRVSGMRRRATGFNGGGDGTNGGQVGDFAGNFVGSDVPPGSVSSSPGWFGTDKSGGASGMPDPTNNYNTGPIGAGATGIKDARRRQADMTGPAMQLEETFSPSEADLIPEGNFEGYLDEVGQGAEEKAGQNFIDARRRQAYYEGYPEGWEGMTDDQEGPRLFNMQPTIDEKHPQIDVDGYLYSWDNVSDQYLKHSPTGGLSGKPLEPGEQYKVLPPRKKRGSVDFAVYKDYCETNGLRVASIDSLDHYAENLSDAQYFRLASIIQRIGGEKPDVGGGSGGSAVGSLPASSIPDFGPQSAEGWGGPLDQGGVADWQPGTGAFSQNMIAPGQIAASRRHAVGGGKTNYLQKADEALTNVLESKAEEFQETIAPLQQALQVIQQAEQAEAAANPMGVQPPAGTVNVLPGQDPSMGGGDPSMGGGDPSMGGGDPMAGGGDPGLSGGDLAQALGLAGAQGQPTPGMEGAQQQITGRQRKIARPNNYREVEEEVGPDGFVTRGGYSAWDCENCGKEVARYRGQGDVSCPECDAQYNAFGQRLRDNWRDNMSNYDDDIGDMEGYEDAMAASEREGRRRQGGRQGGGAYPFVREGGILDQYNSWLKRRKDLPRGGESDYWAFARENGFGENEVNSLKKHFTTTAGRAVPFPEYDGPPLEHAGPDHPARVDPRYEIDPEEGRFRERRQDEYALASRQLAASNRRKLAWSGWGPSQTFVNHKVAGWEWDDHLNGYIANAANKFACSCGESFGVPSYHNCRCGKIYNSYCIGTGGSNHAAAIEKFVCREIPVRDNVIVASRDVEAGIPLGNGDMDSDSRSRRLRGVQRGSSTISESGSATPSFGTSHSARTHSEAQHQREDGYESRVSRRQAGYEESYLADSQSGGPGVSWSTRRTSGSTPQQQPSRQSSGEPGVRNSTRQHAGYGRGWETVAAEQNPLSSRASAGGAESDAQSTASRSSSMSGMRESADYGQGTSRTGFSGRGRSPLRQNHGVEAKRHKVTDPGALDDGEEVDEPTMKPVSNDWRRRNEHGQFSAKRR